MTSIGRINFNLYNQPPKQVEKRENADNNDGFKRLKPQGPRGTLGHVEHRK